MATTEATTTKPKLALITRALLIPIPAALLAVSPLAMGTMQGDPRPAASSIEVERWNFATTAETVAFGTFALSLTPSLLESFRWPRDSRMRCVATTILLVVVVGAIVFIACWMVGLQFFAIPATG
ncbi:hypothetical protein ACNPNP_12000 [Microbacterium sp. AGC85]